MMMKRYKKAFTLVELLIAMVVSSIVLSAVATLAFAMSSAGTSSDNISQKQAQLRFATMKIQELIRHSKMVCSAGTTEISFWRADDDNDDFIDAEELTFMHTDGSDIKMLYVTTSPAGWNDNLKTNYEDVIVDIIQDGSLKTSIISDCEYKDIVLIDDCSNVEIGLDELPPMSEYVSISFDLKENNIDRNYQISASLRGLAYNLLQEDSEGNYVLVSDDD